MASISRSRVLLLAVTMAIVAGLFAGPVAAKPKSKQGGNSKGSANTAQLREAVTLEGVRRHQAAWQAIAEANNGHRFAGLPGHTASAEYVFDQLEAAGYSPWYHTFVYDAFFERTPAELEQVSPNPTTYVNGDDFKTMTYSGSGDQTAPLYPVDAGTSSSPSPDSGCQASDFAGFPAGYIALVQRGGCTFRLKTDNATAAGATGILIYNNIPGLISGTLGAGDLSSIPSMGTTDVLGEQLRAAATGQAVQMRMVTDTGSEPLETMNVLAELPGRDAGNVVMAGAHLDSVNAGPGINDNGSGSGAILETAIQMADMTPRNTVRFAWWSAEESGLVGAREWVGSRTQAELDEIALYLNFDMIGSPNFVRFIYDGDNSAFPVGTGSAEGPAGSGAIEQMFADYFASQGLPSEPTPFSGRSDYGPFIEVGIPAGGLFTGAEGIKTEEQAEIFGGEAGVAYDPCYHKACDDYDNNSDAGLHQMSDAVAHSILMYAQNTEAVNGVKGKGNYKAKKSGGASSSGTGTGSGGGLHDDHDHDEES